MAIQWGSWDYGGGNGMRVGVDASVEAVDHLEIQVTFTFKIYTENQYNYADTMTMNFDGDLSGSSSFSNNTGGSQTLRFTKTYNVSIPTGSYGTSSGSVSGGGHISGAYNGVTPGKTVSLAIPARPYDVPAEPTANTLVRNSDTSSTMTWTNHATAGEPYTSLTIQRRVFDNGAWGTYVTVATLSGTATSWTDTTTVADQAYNWTVRANNSVGSSAYVGLPSQVLNTPAAPSSVTAALSGTSVVVNWVRHDNGSSYIRFEVQRSVNGAAFANVALALNAVTWTDAAPGAGTNQYRVRPVNTTINTLAGAYTNSNTVTTLVAPKAPTSLAPNGKPIDLTVAQTFTWKHNNGGDGQAQQAYQVRFTHDSGATWPVITPQTTSAVSSYSLPANTLAPGGTWGWQVATRGAAAAWSPWSVTATMSLPPYNFEQWNGTTLSGRTLDGVWDGTTIQDMLINSVQVV